jgi:hypothetical protein
MTACPDVKDRLTLWNNHKDDMSEDLLYEERKRNPVADYTDVHNRCLIEIEDKILQISNKDLSEFAGLPIPEQNVRRMNIEERRETYDMNILNEYVNDNEEKLTEEQIQSITLSWKTEKRVGSGFWMHQEELEKHF